MLMKKEYDNKELKTEEVKQVKEIIVPQKKKAYSFPNEWRTIYATSLEEATTILNSNNLN